MNRIILIGNGFDLAHGLKTGYRDFMDDYWTNILNNISSQGYIKLPYKKDEFELVQLKLYENGEETSTDSTTISFAPNPCKNIYSYNDVKKNVKCFNSHNSTVNLECKIIFKNKFFEHLSEKTCLSSWLDIENEYYTILKDCFKKRTERLYEDKWPSVKDLNDEFCQVKNALEKYLTKACKQEEEQHKSIKKALLSVINLDEVARAKRLLFFDQIKNEWDEDAMQADYDNESREHPEYIMSPEGGDPINEMIKDKLKYNELDEHIRPLQTLFLNFNYTDTAKKLYAQQDEQNYSVINIHGELNNKTNPIIFGYGDELDEDYKEIEKTQDNEYLQNIKSIQYLNTPNYRNLLDFLQLAPYQVFIMGHSCGNSDRTLLKTVFEHSNCISIKPFYWQREDGTDDYTNIVANISRNFNKKQALRDIVVNKKYCEPLVPTK